MSFNEWHFNEFCKDNYDLESDQQKAIYDRIHSHASEKSKKDAQEEAWGFQQAKIDELNEKHSEEKRILHNVIDMNQTKIDELQARIRIYEKHVKAIKHIHETQFDENTDTSFILGNLDGFIEYLENDLKGNKDEN